MPQPISLGKDLWANQFYKPEYICEDWMFELIEDVNLSIMMDIPIAPNLKDCPVLISDYYEIIKEEMAGMNG